jgi:hypothetical protein
MGENNQDFGLNRTKSAGNGIFLQCEDQIFQKAPDDFRESLRLSDEPSCEVTGHIHIIQLKDFTI